MKVGDLVTVGPAHASVYLLVSMEARPKDCVMLFHPEAGPLPMEKQYVKVVSERT